MTYRVLDAGELLSEQEIASVESQLGFSLPGDYRNFLLSHNGGRPEPRGFAIESDKPNDRSVVHYFFCANKGDVYDLVTWAKRARGRIPANLLPVALDPFGNLICLSVSGGERGKVYFWDHEREAGESDSPGYDNVYFVADSFRDFLDSLT